ncbi:MAG TPA: hypothetical protein DCY94_03515, partial [Firmicutes bacterium]|nr:hypothetical protein [Bacillota bacterium]
MPEELTIEQKIKIIEDTAISLEIAQKSGKLEETVRELIPEKILKVARLIDEVPQDKIANCIDILMSASKMAFKMTIEYYTELCSLI